MLPVQTRNEYQVHAGIGVPVLQRSRNYPYLWIRIYCGLSGYISGLAHSSICCISWIYHSLLKTARSQLRDTLLSRRVEADPEDEVEEE